MDKLRKKKKKRAMRRRAHVDWIAPPLRGSPFWREEFERMPEEDEDEEVTRIEAGEDAPERDPDDRLPDDTDAEAS